MYEVYLVAIHGIDSQSPFKATPFVFRHRYWGIRGDYVVLPIRITCSQA